MSAIILSNARLRVEIARPGTVYRGTRFDWNGLITQVTLQQQGVAFCAPESLVPGQGSGGIGLCGEFGIQEPIGYEEIEPGELFPKLGVGLLTKTANEPYAFMKPYPCQPYATRIEQVSNEEVRFTSEPLACRGYAVRYEKRVRLEGRRLVLAYRLANVGERLIHTTEYMHNFVGMNGRNYDSGHRLKFLSPALREQAAKLGMPEVFAGKDSGYAWKAVPEREYYARFQAGLVAGPQWELADTALGVAVRESVDFAPLRFALWGKAHVASPEVFAEIRVKPGETQSWERTYEFDEAVDC